MSAPEGFFLVFEGVEGAGKSTHARRLARRLEAAGRRCLLVREPGGTPTGERIRRLVLDPELQMTAETELLLLLAARAEFVRKVVRPALARGEVVLADRYEMSTFAYQGTARGLDPAMVRRLNAFATDRLKPHAVILLAVDSGEGMRRKRDAADRMEQEGASFHRRVARAYERLAREEPDVLVVDSSVGRAEVETEILRVLGERWPETFRLDMG